MRRRGKLPAACWRLVGHAHTCRCEFVRSTWSFFLDLAKWNNDESGDDDDDYAGGGDDDDDNDNNNNGNKSKIY